MVELLNEAIEEINLLKELLKVCAKRLNEYEDNGEFERSERHEMLISLIEDVTEEREK